MPHIVPMRIYALCPQAVRGIVEPAAPVLDAGLAGAGIVTPRRLAYFMAQLAAESQGFSRIEENLRYGADRIAAVFPKLATRAASLADNPEALANAAYAGELGNGPEASGDGFKFRGRGLIQITGRWNYAFFGGRIDEALQGNPDLAADPAIAARVSLAYWKSRDCNTSADAEDLEAVTRRVNGGLNGLDERRAYLEHAKKIFV